MMNMNMPSGAPVSPQIFKEASWRHMPACDVCPARRRNGKSPRECGSVELLEKTKLAETPQAAIDMRHADSRKSCAGKSHQVQQAIVLPLRLASWIGSSSGAPSHALLRLPTRTTQRERCCYVPHRKINCGRRRDDVRSAVYCSSVLNPEDGSVVRISLC